MLNSSDQSHETSHHHHDMLIHSSGADHSGVGRFSHFFLLLATVTIHRDSQPSLTIFTHPCCRQLPAQKPSNSSRGLISADPTPTSPSITSSSASTSHQVQMGPQIVQSINLHLSPHQHQHQQHHQQHQHHHMGGLKDHILPREQPNTPAAPPWMPPLVHIPFLHAHRTTQDTLMIPARSVKSHRLMAALPVPCVFGAK